MRSIPPTPCSERELKCVGNENFTDYMSGVLNWDQADVRLAHYPLHHHIRPPYEPVKLSLDEHLTWKMYFLLAFV